MRTFDRKFGSDFLAGVPPLPGVYRFYDEAGTLLYVGKARDLRRRLAQYRTTRRRQRDRKRRELVRAAARIVWDVAESELDASLREVRMIQALGPRGNIASAFPFLYPFVGVHAGGREVYFCLTTSPGAFPAFSFHGAFRSRRVTSEAFFALRRLLAFVGHPMPRRQCAGLGSAPHSHVFGIRRLPAEWPAMWDRLLRKGAPEALHALALRLLEHAGALARRELVHDDLRALGRFVDEEVSPLARAISATGYERYPIPQGERDCLFLEYRHRAAEPGRRGG